MFSITTTRNSELWQKIWNNGKTSVLHMTNPVKLLPMFVRSTQFFENFPKFYMKEKVDRKGRRGTKKEREASSEYLLYFYIFLFGPPLSGPSFHLFGPSHYPGCFPKFVVVTRYPPRRLAKMGTVINSFRGSTTLQWCLGISVAIRFRLWNCDFKVSDVGEARIFQLADM